MPHLFDYMCVFAHSHIIICIVHINIQQTDFYIIITNKKCIAILEFRDLHLKFACVGYKVPIKTINLSMASFENYNHHFSFHSIVVVGVVVVELVIMWWSRIGSDRIGVGQNNRPIVRACTSTGVCTRQSVLRTRTDQWPLPAQLLTMPNSFRGDAQGKTLVADAYKRTQTIRTLAQARIAFATQIDDRCKPKREGRWKCDVLRCLPYI